MSKTLKLAEGLSLPIDAVTEKLAWLGRTGSGKTYGAMKLAELMLEAGAQIGVLDPVGVWRALRVPADKGGQSFEVVVFGGLYGDVPLEPGAGELIADLVVDRVLSFVLDVSQFIPSEQQTFARAFAHRFFHRKKSAPSAVHLFLEECQEFIPENPSGREALTLGEFQRLWKLGRNFGIGGSLISQRPQEIAKKALNMSGTLFAFQMTGPQERKAVRAWVADQGIATDIESVLQKLQTGEPHVESPTFLEASKTVRILPRVTADLSSTPKVGASTAARRPLTPIDVEQLRVSMSDTIEKAKAEDPRQLRKALAEKDKRIRELERHNSASGGIEHHAERINVLSDADRELIVRVHESVNAARAVFIEQADVIHAGLEEAFRLAMQDAASRLSSDSKRAAESVSALFERDEVKQALEKLARVSAPPQYPRERPGQSRPLAAQPGRATVAARSSPSVPADPRIERAAERKILTALAMYPDGRSTKQVAILAGYAMNGGGFRNALGRMRSLGFVEGSGDRLRITDAGVQALGPVDPLPQGRDLFNHWMGQLDRKAEREILQVLVDAYPHALTADAVAARTETKYEANGGGFRNALGKLRTLELVEGRGALRASEELFS